MITFTVHGAAVPQGSMRHVGRGIMVHSNKALLPWREQVRACALAAGVLCGSHDDAKSLEVLYYVQRPKSHYGKRGLKESAPQYPTNRRGGDADKVLRAIGDALTGVAWMDDSQIVTATVRKCWATESEPEARTEITIGTLGGSLL